MRGLARSSCPLPRAPTRATPWSCGVAEGPGHRLDDHVLLGRLLRGVLGGATRAVVGPRVDVERHVDHVDARRRRDVRERVVTAEEEVAAVLAAAHVDELSTFGATPRDARSRSGRRRSCRPRGCRARRRRRSAGSTQPAHSHGTVDVDHVGGEVARERASKFGAMSGWEASTPVSMMPTLTRLSPISMRCASDGVDHVHAPQVGVERVAGPASCPVLGGAHPVRAPSADGAPARPGRAGDTVGGARPIEPSRAATLTPPGCGPAERSRPTPTLTETRPIVVRPRDHCAARCERRRGDRRDSPRRGRRARRSSRSAGGRAPTGVGA